MPRKNKGMWYEVHPTPVKGKDGKNLVYVRPQSGMKLSMKQLEEYSERMTSPESQNGMSFASAFTEVFNRKRNAEKDKSDD